MSLKIYVAGHKKFCPPFDATYVPIIGGMSTRENKDELADFIGDDTGDNISSLNNIFCELTVQYWIWKNDHSSDFVGLNHYRRYFSKKDHGTNLYYKYMNDVKVVCEGDEIAAGDDFDFSKVDMIAPLRHHGEPVLRQYARHHVLDDMLLVSEQIRAIQPDYVNACDFYFNNCDYFHHTNMIIARKEIFDAYSEWLFSLLMPLADKKFFSNYDNYQKRVMGFLSERLLSVWILKNRRDFAIEERGFVQVREL